MRILTLISALVLIATPLMSCAQIDTTHETTRERQVVKLAILGGRPPVSGGEDIAKFLAETLYIDTEAESYDLQLHIFAMKDGELVGDHVSKAGVLRRRPTRSKDDGETSLRVRPGRATISMQDALPSAEFFDGLTIEQFYVPNRGRVLGEGLTMKEMAVAAFKATETSDGIFIVTSWDDMLKGDATIGLVGFGSW